MRIIKESLRETRFQISKPEHQPQPIADNALSDRQTSFNRVATRDSDREGAFEPFLPDSGVFRGARFQKPFPDALPADAALGNGSFCKDNPALHRQNSPLPGSVA